MEGLARPDDAAPVMVSVSEAARLKGLTKQTISEKLARLVAEGRITTSKRGREKIFPLAVYDAAFDETTDPARVIAQATAKSIRAETAEEARPSSLARPSEYNEALTRKARLDADARQIDIDKQLGRLLPVDEVVAAMQDCAAAIVRDIDQLPTFADDLAAAMTEGGVAGLRDALKRKARTMRETLERTMKLTAANDAADDDEDAA